MIVPVRSKFFWSTIFFILLSLVLLSASYDIGAIVDNNIDNITIRSAKTQAEESQDVVTSRFQAVSLEVKSGDTFGTLMQHLGLDYNQAYKLLEHEQANIWLTNRLKIGKKLDLVIDNQNLRLHQLSMQIDPNTWLEASWIDDQNDYRVIINEVKTDKQQVYVESTIEQSFYVDAIDKGVPAAVALAFADLLAWDIDFIHDIRVGDSFSILYEKHYINGEQIPLYSILAAQFVSSDNNIFAIGYSPASEDQPEAGEPLGSNKKSYYSIEGKPLKKQFLRMPLKFGRISSGYNLKRVHPLFGTIRPHRGIDYAAPRHTPIHSVANGKIAFRGWQKGYGNVVIVAHDNGISTLYAHMQNFATGQRVGSKVKQGQTIGFVGTTGYSTGPHVHFEFKKNGKHKDPMKVKLPNDKPLNPEEIQEFFKVRDRVMATFNLQRRAYYALNDS